MDTKLKNITTQYRKFNENQALTEGQLNEFIDYFEDQDRLSRTRLSGVGIVCGFKSTKPFTASSSQEQNALRMQNGGAENDVINAITITQGVGVTTDGDLITLRQKVADSTTESTIDFEDKKYTHYRVYEDNYNYPHFFNGNVQMPLLELLTLEEYTTLQSQSPIDTTLSTIDTISNLNSKIIILYLESYSNEETPCKDADCDNNGAEQVSNLKVLLADASDVENYMVNKNAEDSIYRFHNRYEVLFDALPNIEAKRAILNPSITKPVELKDIFQNAIQNPNTVSDLTASFAAIASTFGINFSETLQNKLDNLFNTIDSDTDDYQYRYDLLKDLIDTYNEIKELVLHLKVHCCPSIASFPKHIMLGAVGAPLNLGDYTQYRHGFYNSPINTNDDENYERLILLANRFVEKIKEFQSYVGQIKITPSNLNVRLGEKAIPYYYNVTNSLLEKWNFEKTQTDREKYNLSYHTTNLVNEDFVKNPLKYNIDNNDFYNIEGHIGMPYKTALQNINDIKTQYGLAFDVIALVLQKGVKGNNNTPTEAKTVSIDELRKQLVSISNDVSKQTNDSQSTLETIFKLDSQLRLLNQVEFSSTPGSAGEGVTVLRQDPKKDDVVSELLSEFLERKSGLEHFAGVERGGTFVLVYESETNSQVLADFSLPYLCCSKKDPVFLVLPASELCQKDAPIAITILPLDGEVKAFVNGVQINNAIIQTPAGESMFNPGAITTQFGQPITFTVNDDPVDSQIIVHENPEIVSVTSGAINYATATTDENANNPDATVEFNVVGNLTGLTFTWNFGDGTPIINNESPTAKRTHVYNLVAGEEVTFNPTLTVTNANDCSTLYPIAPLKLTGQSTIACLSGMRIVVQFRYGPDGGHTCNRASFDLLGNGLPIQGTTPYVDPNGIIKGNIHLSNTGQSQDAGNIIPGGHSYSRYNEIIITQDEAEQLAAGATDGFVQFSLVCALPASVGCHQGVAYTEIYLANDPVPIYHDYPQGNFLEINPCTGVTR